MELDLLVLVVTRTTDLVKETLLSSDKLRGLTEVKSTTKFAAESVSNPNPKDRERAGDAPGFTSE